MSTAASNPSDFKQGTIIHGLYEVQKVVGEGGFGLVLQVTHLEWGIDMAVKLPKPQVAGSKEQSKRVVREAETWIELGSHPNIVQCWFVRAFEGLPILFLDFLAGGSLNDWLKGGLLKPGEWSTILDLTIQAADGLAYAHSQGLIHRDVKPANLMVAGVDRLCVTDFGLVTQTTPAALEAMASPQGEGPDRTFAGGTPNYAAPEQWLGEASVAVDIYSLGATLYHFCSGRLPFYHDNPAETVKLHMNAPVPPLEAPPALSEVVMAALEKKPEKRPSSMMEFRNRLAQAYHQITGTPYPRPLPEPTLPRAAGLNNKGVSLWNLGHQEQALTAWDEACQLDGRQPEAVYNRALGRWRRRELDESSVLQQLEVAQAPPHFTGYFLLESGRAQEAVAVLSEAAASTTAEAEGRLQRALGDAYMYSDDFAAAQQAYSRALERMPKDGAGRRRLAMANEGSRSRRGRVYFPRFGPVMQDQAPHSVALLQCESRTGAMLCAGEGFVSCRHPQSGSLLWRSWLPQVPRQLVGDTQCLYPLGAKAATALSFLDGKPVWQVEGKETVAVCLEARLALVDYQLLHLDSGQVVTELQPRDKVLTRGVFASQGAALVTGSSDGYLKLWDTAKGKIVWNWRVHKGPLNTLYQVGEGDVILTGAAGEPLRFWKIGEQTPLYQIKDADYVRTELSQDEKYLLGFKANREFELLELGKGVIFSGLGAAALVPGGLAYDDGQRLAFWSFAGRVRQRLWAPHGQALLSICSDPAGGRLLTGSSRGILQWWEFDETTRVYQRELEVTRGITYVQARTANLNYENAMKDSLEHFERDPLVSLKFLGAARKVEGYARDERSMAQLARFYAIYRRARIKEIWEQNSFQLSSPTAQVRLRAAGSVAALDLHGNLELLPGSGNKAATDVSAIDGEVVGFYSGRVTRGDKNIELQSPVQLLLAGLGRALAATENGLLYLLDTDQGKVVLALRDQDSPERVLAATSDLNLALTGPELALRDFAKGVQLEVSGSYPEVVAADLSNDGQYALLATPGHRLELWRLANGRQCKVLPGHTDRVLMVRLWEGLKVVVSASRDGNVAFWDLEKGDALHVFAPHQGGLRAAWADREGRRVVTVGGDRTVKVWETEWELDTAKKCRGLEEIFGGGMARLKGFLKR